MNTYILKRTGTTTAVVETVIGKARTTVGLGNIRVLVQDHIPTAAEMIAAFAPPALTIQEQIDSGFRFLASQGYTDNAIKVLQDKLYGVEGSDPTFAAHAKLKAVYTWVQQVKADFLAGHSSSVPAPYSLDAVLAEQ